MIWYMSVTIMCLWDNNWYYGSRTLRFNTTNVIAHHWAQSWVRSIHLWSPQTIFLRYILMFSHLLLGFPSRRLKEVSAPKFCVHSLSPNPSHITSISTHKDVSHRNHNRSTSKTIDRNTARRYTEVSYIEYEIAHSVQWLLMSWTTGVRISAGAGIFLFATTPRPASGPIQLRI
jgi:hypothetical protein